MKRRLNSILFGIATCLILIASGIGVVYAGYGINNTAGLSFSDAKGRICPNVYDTAALWIIKGPEIGIAKDVRNLRSNETSTEIINALHGDTVEFILTITNNGDYYARDVVVIDSIPSGTIYETGSAFDTGSLDPVDPPDTITFQHIAGGEFDRYDTAPVTAIKWIWDRMESKEQGYNIRVTKFRVRIE